MKTIKIILFCFLLLVASKEVIAQPLVWSVDFWFDNPSGCQTRVTPYVTSQPLPYTFSTNFKITEALCGINPVGYYDVEIKFVQDGSEYSVWTANNLRCGHHTANIEILSSFDICYAKPAKLKIIVNESVFSSTKTSYGHFALYSSYANTETCNDDKMLINGNVSQVTPNSYTQYFYPRDECFAAPIPTPFSAIRYKIEWTINGNFTNKVPLINQEQSRGYEPWLPAWQDYKIYFIKESNSQIKFYTYAYFIWTENQSAYWPTNPEKCVVVYKMVDQAAPIHNGMGGNISDNKIYLGETMRIYAFTQGYTTSYDWVKKYCGNSFNCNDIPQGLEYTQNSNYFQIKNNNYTGVVCDEMCGNSESNEVNPLYDAEEVITLRLDAKACNPFGCSQVLSYPTDPAVRITPMNTFRPPTFTGCPQIITFKDGITDYENNLLHRNEAIGFGADLDDYIVIKNDITESDSTVSLYIKETDDKYNYFDQIKMYAYDVPPGCKVVISENNQFYLFDTTIMASSSEATLNNEEDITSLIQYNPSVVPDNDFLGNAQDVINADFSSGDIKNISTDFYNMFQDSINNGQTDSIALIIQMDRNPNHNANVKMDAGTVMVTTENDIRYYTIFRRENMDYMVLPISTRDDKVSNINITMNRDYRIRFIGVTGILNITEGMAELSLIEAFHSDTNLMVPPSAHIVSQDDDYLTLDSSQYLKLTYSSLPYLVAADYTRKHILFVNGHYTGILGRPTSVVSNDNTDKFELFENKPNPFNPTTTISFSLPKDSFVKIKVYNLLGQLIATLSNEVKKAGYNEVKFDGTNLASGIYFYHFDVEGIQRIKKMVLIK